METENLRQARSRASLAAALMLWLGSLAPGATAQDILGRELLHCDQGNVLLTRCRVPETELVPHQCVGSADNRRCFEVAVKVSYLFPCNGHPVGFGVASEHQGVEFAYGAAPEPLVLVGHGPFTLKDLDPELTRRAALEVGCSLKVTAIEKDLSRDSREILEARLSDMRFMNELLGRTKSAERLSTTVRGILYQIDIPALTGLLRTLVGQVELLEESYDDAEAAEALGRLRVRLEESIHRAGTASDPAAFRAEVDALMEDLASQAAELAQASATAVARLFVHGMEMLAFAGEATARHYDPLFREEDRKATALTE